MEMSGEMLQETAERTWKHFCVMLMVMKDGGAPLPEFAGDWAPVSRAEWDDKIYEVTKLRKLLRRARQSPAEAPQSSSSDNSTPSDEDEEQRKKRKARKRDGVRRKKVCAEPPPPFGKQ